MEILNHHGGEHYCPVSLFRIYGVSEIELMGGDDDDDDLDIIHSDLAALEATVDPEDVVPGECALASETVLSLFLTFDCRKPRF